MPRHDGYRIVSQHSLDPRENRMSILYDDEQAIARAQTRINEICLTCRTNEQEWLEYKKRFRLVDLVCLLVSLILACLSISAATWLLFFSDKYDFIKLLVGRFQVSSDILILLPLVYFVADAIWILLEIVQLIFSLQINKILNFDQKKMQLAEKEKKKGQTKEKKKKDKKKPTKKSGDESLNVPKIHDEYLSISPVPQQTSKILDTIERLKQRIELKLKFRLLRRWFFVYSLLINIIFILLIMAPKLTMLTYLLRHDMIESNGQEPYAQLFDFVYDTNRSSLLTNSRDMVSNRIINVPFQAVRLFNTNIDSKTMFYSDFARHFDCCYFGTDAQSPNETSSQVIISNDCDVSSTQHECMYSMQYDIKFLTTSVAIVFLGTMLLTFILQAILAFNLHFQLFMRIINESCDLEVNLDNEYEQCRNQIFNKSVMKQLEQNEESMATHFDELLADAAKKRPHLINNTQNQNQTATSLFDMSKIQAQGQLDDDFDASYDELPQDVRNTLNEFNKSLRSFDDFSDDDDDNNNQANYNGSRTLNRTRSSF